MNDNYHGKHNCRSILLFLNAFILLQLISYYHVLSQESTSDHFNIDSGQLSLNLSDDNNSLVELLVLNDTNEIAPMVDLQDLSEKVQGILRYLDLDPQGNITSIDIERGILKYNDTEISDPNLKRDESEIISIDETRKRLPDCPMSCEDGWVGDNWCDSECNIKECAYDDGDCEGWCKGSCRPSWPGDGECDLPCYDQLCNYDGGDCKDADKIRKLLTNSNMADVDGFDYSHCNCPQELLGDGQCDAECNNFECNLDRHDCLHSCSKDCPLMWLGDGTCDRECDNEFCKFDKGDCSSCSAGCRTWMLGNGICDVQCKNVNCEFDGGDCEGIASVTLVDYSVDPPKYVFCAHDFIGDGFCDPECFNEDANWDGGDCGPPPTAPQDSIEPTNTHEAPEDKK